uniref:ARAD1D34804p n=1 Tax=Blastobotrys adeninivorans TaxID=409370 RepID=A0A060TCA8_BLAAD
MATSGQQQLEEAELPPVHQIQENGEEQPPDLRPQAILAYLKSRVPTLRPPSAAERTRAFNPWPALRKINLKQWMFILVAFLGWTWDAFDFFSVSLTATDIAETLDRSVTDITWGITLVLMLRSVGAVVFGLAADRWGRKWPFIINCFMFFVIELASGFVQTYKQFLGVRALFGIAMGGIYGNCAATALDDCPVEARGFISGLLQQGYAFGYLLGVIFNRAITYNSPHGWRALFWFGACPPLLICLFRFFLPETETYLAQRELETESAGKAFVHQGKKAVKVYWLMCIFLVFFMAGMNFMSHGSQDLYPTMLTAQRQFSKDASTVTNSVANLGALAGGITLGHISEFAGRRLTLMVACVIGGALIYPWGFSTTNAGLNASVFFLQFFVQGAWGVVPIHISELAPPAFRAFVVGVSYQLGNLASSASSTIESTIGERFPLVGENGEKVEGKYDYGKVMAIFMGCVFGYVLIVSFLGPERRHASLLTRLTDEEVAEAHEKHLEVQKGVSEHRETA